MSNPAYPDDFIGKLEFFGFSEQPSGYREEQWLTPTSLITCIWFPPNDSDIPNTMLYQHF